MEVNDLFSITTSHITFEEIMHSVHGNKNLHFGASQTWAAAKANFPMAKGITIEAVRRWVRECPICQKHRDTGIRGLPEEIRTLKDKGWRSVIGVDMISVQKDRNQNAK